MAPGPSTVTPAAPWVPTREPGVGPGPVAAPRGGRRATLAAYVALTKPRIIELLLVVTVPVMFLAAAGVPSLLTVVETLVGGALAAGSANALNCYLDRDIDVTMRRTRSRPLPARTVSPRRAAVFGVVLGIVAVAGMAVTVNLLSAVLTLAAILFYLIVYTVLLKRRTWQNVIWGGVAGCFPALIGWTAVTDRLAWPPFVLFVVVFLWTPPHTWALGMRYGADYAAAKVPMLPVVAGPVRVARQIVGYSIATVAASVLLWPVAHTTLLYPLAALAAGSWLIAEALGLARRARRVAAAGLVGPEGNLDASLKPMRLFHATNTHLALVFLAVAVDSLLR